MIFQTKTKINIGLSVVNKREDGYHDIESIFYPLAFGDVLEVIPSEGKGKIDFKTYGIDIPGNPSKNLCVKAYHLLNKDFNLPSIKSALLKRVPIGAGLGGGSSDGVEMLKALNQLFELNLSKDILKNYALQLGSDCPFFVENTPKLIEGRGEKMKGINLDLTNYWIALIFPKFHVSTPLAYSLITPKKSKFNLSKINTLPIDDWRRVVINDFESPISLRHPKVNTIKKQLLDSGALYVSMTGSGSTIYGIFNKRPLIKGFKHNTWVGPLLH